MKNKTVALLKQWLILLTLSVVIACSVLYVSGLIPQQWVEQNFRRSAIQIEKEGVYPKMFSEETYNSRMDNFTESIILMSTYYMNTRDFPQAIVQNPYRFDAIQTPTLCKAGEDGEMIHHYTRYWMGFRAPLRILLSIFSYGEMRFLLSVLFFMLLAAAMISMQKHIGPWYALCFAGSIALVNLPIVSSSLQFSTCYLLSFLLMLLLPGATKQERVPLSIFFATGGILTQFFDFYTAPILTFLYPCIYLVLLRKEKGSIRCLMGFFVAWLLGYALMWLLKLGLTTLITGYNAFTPAFSSFSRRVGLYIAEELRNEYNPMMAIGKSILAYAGNLKLLLLGGGGYLLVFSFLLVHALKKKEGHMVLKTIKPFLAMGLCPFLWFCIAAQPTVVHYWFQYRGISAAGFAGFILLVQLASPKSAA